MDKLLNELEHNLQSLFNEKKRLELLTQQQDITITQQRNELILTHKQLAELQQEIKNLKTANAMLQQSGDTQEAKRKINHLIYLVDKTLNQLTM